jgi:hypothetical protein
LIRIGSAPQLRVFVCVIIRAREPCRAGPDVCVYTPPCAVRVPYRCMVHMVGFYRSLVWPPCMHGMAGPGSRLSFWLHVLVDRSMHVLHRLGLAVGDQRARMDIRACMQRACIRIRRPRPMRMYRPASAESDHSVYICHRMHTCIHACAWYCVYVLRAFDARMEHICAACGVQAHTCFAFVCLKLVSFMQPPHAAEHMKKKKKKCRNGVHAP